MSSKSPPYLADFDSATAMLKALSRFLNNRDFPALGQSRRLEPFTRIVNYLPNRWREKVFEFSGALEAISPKKLSEVSADEIARWAVSQYPQRRYPAAMIGSSNGALIHLCAALQIPWLPQTWLIPVRQSVDPDEPKQALELGRELGRQLLEVNPELQLHHMHDPSQDRRMVRYLTYFRVKRRCLGPSYERFLMDNLEPGGTLFVVDCQYTWPTTRVGEHHVFQHGAIGGVTKDEYMHGGPRVEEFLERAGSPRRKWDPPAPDGESPEAEWGFESALGEDVERFAKQHGYRLKQIVFSSPEELSPLVADFYRWWYRKRKVRSNRLLAESFVLMEPWWVLRTGTVPFWMEFNMEPSAEQLEHYLSSRESFDHIHIMLFAHGAESIGLPPIERWQALLNRAQQNGSFIGVEPKAYPRDFAIFSRYHTELAKIPARYPMPAPLPLNQLDRFLEETGERYAVSWQ